MIAESQKAGILSILDTEEHFQIIEIEEHSAKITGNFVKVINNSSIDLHFTSYLM